MTHWSEGTRPQQVKAKCKIQFSLPSGSNLLIPMTRILP
jgi:hypothetical protein